MAPSGPRLSVGKVHLIRRGARIRGTQLLPASQIYSTGPCWSTLRDGRLSQGGGIAVTVRKPAIATGPRPHLMPTSIRLNAVPDTSANSRALCALRRSDAAFLSPSRGVHLTRFYDSPDSVGPLNAARQALARSIGPYS